MYSATLRIIWYIHIHSQTSVRWNTCRNPLRRKQLVANLRNLLGQGIHALNSYITRCGRTAFIIRPPIEKSCSQQKCSTHLFQNLTSDFLFFGGGRSPPTPPPFIISPFHIHSRMIHTKFHRNRSTGSEKPLWGGVGGEGGMVKSFDRNPFNNTQG